MGTHEFRRLWYADTTGALGGWMTQVALFVAVLTTHGVAALAWLALAGTVPPLLAGPLLGTAADRWDPARTSRLAGLGQALTVGALAALLGGSLVMVAALFALANTLRAIANPARQRLLYQVVAEPDRPRANARISTSTGIVTIAGAALGGGVALIGPAAAIGISAAIRLVGVLLLYGVRPRAGEVRAAAVDREPYLRALAAGFRALRSFPAATSVVLVGIAWGLIGGSYDVLLTEYGAGLLHGGPAGVGALYAVDGLGVIVGTLVAGRIPGRLHGPLYGLGYMLQGLFWTLFALSRTLAVAAPLLLAMRLASGLIIAWDTTLLLQTVPDALHGRVFSLHAATYGAVMRLSLALTGVLLAVVGARPIAVGAGIGSIVVGLTWWLAAGRHWPDPRQPAAAEPPAGDDGKRPLWPPAARPVPRPPQAGALPAAGRTPQPG